VLIKYREKKVEPEELIRVFFNDLDQKTLQFCLKNDPLLCYPDEVILAYLLISMTPNTANENQTCFYFHVGFADNCFE
jgi:hypothetical protein